jgi:SAM-dependent methyltransferase
MERYGWREMEAALSRLGRPCRLLVDAGCGNGQFSQFYLEQGVERVVGLDFSERMLAAACERAARVGMDSRFLPVWVDLRRLDALRSGIADMVQLYGVTEHLDDPVAVLIQLARLLAPGGLLLVSVPRRGSLGWLFYALFGQSPSRWGLPRSWRDRFRIRERLRYYRFYTGADVERMCRAVAEQGLELVERRRFADLMLSGPPSRLFHALGRRGDRGYRWLDRLDGLLRRLPTPAAEYLLFRRRGA